MFAVLHLQWGILYGVILQVVSFSESRIIRLMSREKWVDNLSVSTHF